MNRSDILIPPNIPFFPPKDELENEYDLDLENDYQIDFKVQSPPSTIDVSYQMENNHTVVITEEKKVITVHDNFDSKEIEKSQKSTSFRTGPGVTGQSLKKSKTEKKFDGSIKRSRTLP